MIKAFKNKTFFEKIVVSCLALLLVLFLLNTVFRFFDKDEIVNMHCAWKLSQGEAIYKDFMYHHHPLFYYFLSFFISLFGPAGEILIGARLLIYIIMLVILWFTYHLAKLIFNDKRISILSVLLNFCSSA